MEGSDDDEVIRELDVVVCDYPNMFLAQYPLKPVYAEPMHISHARYKAENRILEIKTPYFKSSSQEYNIDTEGQNLTSTEIVPMNSLGAAFISDNTMYIVPVESIYQMRPSLQQYNKKLAQETVELREELDEEEEEDEQEAQAATTNASMQQVQLRRKESEKAQSARLQSYSYVKQREEDEPWRSMQIFPIGTQQSDDKFGDIVARAVGTGEES